MSLEHDVEHWIEKGMKKAVKNVLRPILDPMKHELGTMVSQLTQIPGELQGFEEKGVSLGKKLAAEVPHIWKELEVAVESAPRLVQTGLTFEAKKGGEVKTKLQKWAKDFKVTLANLEKLSAKTRFFDPHPFEIAGQFLDKVDGLTWAISDELVAPLAFMDPYLDFYGFRGKVQTFVETLESALGSGGSEASPEAGAKTRKDVAISLYVASVATSTFYHASNYLVAAFPFSVKLGGSAGVAFGVDAEGEAGLTIANVSGALVGLFAAISGILLDMESNFMNVLDDVL